MEFLQKLQNSTIGNKIIRSNAFKNYTAYSLGDCFAQALELECEYQVGEVVLVTMDPMVLSVETPSGNAEVHEMNVDAEPERRLPAYNPNPCCECKEIGLFKKGLSTAETAPAQYSG